MCTAISVRCNEHYFGRNLDYEHSFGEEITITPRNFKFKFRNLGIVDTHYAIIGMALVEEGFPLYFDATNEKGLSAAGLNFPEFACYNSYEEGKQNIAPFEFIPWVLSQCADVSETKKLLENMNIENINFNDKLKNTPLHWIVSDKDSSITVEPTVNGLEIFENPVGVLTNSPGFEYHMFNLNNYMSLSEKTPQNSLFKDLDLSVYSRGMGAIGIPGDLSSMSRFVRACFVREKSIFSNEESENVSQFFHVLYSVYQLKGCVKINNSLFEKTNYSSCCNTDRGIYYYTTYENMTIHGIDMYKEDLDSDDLISFEIENKQKIFIQN